MWAWIVRFASGLLPGQKPWGEYFGKILWVVAIVLIMGIGTNLFEKFFPTKPPVTNIGSGGTQIINQAEPRDMMGIGCNMWRGYLKMGIKTK